MQNGDVHNSAQNRYNAPEVVELTWNLDRPCLEELVPLMDEHLSPYFNRFAVNVVECPDLTLFPYFLTAPGLCGQAEVIEFGNYEHLYNPAKNKTVSWFLSDLLNRYTNETSLIIGETMYRGIPNKEVVMNLTYSSDSGIHKRESNYIFLNEEGQIGTECVLNSVPPYCDLYGSLYVCSGERKQVLEVYAKEARDPDVQILSLMRNALRDKYFNSEVGLSGLLFIGKGEVEATVMPRTFSQTLLQETEKIYEWNHKCNITAPVVVHNTMFNFCELCFESDNGLMFCTANHSSSQILRNPNEQLMGSKFLRITTPCTMECKGYFNVVSKLHRVGAEAVVIN